MAGGQYVRLTPKRLSASGDPIPYKAYGSIVTLWCHQMYGKYDDLWEIYGTYIGNMITDI